MFSVTYFTPQWQSQGVVTKTIWPTRTKNQLPGASKKKKMVESSSTEYGFFLSIVISESESCSVVSDSLWPHIQSIYSPYTVHRIIQARIREWVAVPFSRDLPNPEIELGSPALQADSSIIIRRVAIGANNLSLLICWIDGTCGIFQWECSSGDASLDLWHEILAKHTGMFTSSRQPPQGWNQGFLWLLHCRQILFHWATEPLGKMVLLVRHHTEM